jgi:bacillithiol biosynthesis cysteine-adding enzyme BshC
MDYLESDEFLKKFYIFDPSKDGIKSRIDSYRNPRLDRTLLKSKLSEQYKKSGISVIHPSVSRNLDALGDNDTFTVSTGHQLNILSGPLYVMYKLVSAVNLAEKLNSIYPDCHFVPVYWMATEDHDIQEISSVTLFSRKYQWESNWKGISGSMPLEGFEKVWTEIKSNFGNSKFGAELSSLVESSYLNSSTLAEATRKWVNALMGKYGLLVLDGNDPSFKKSFEDIISDEIENQTSFNVVEKTISQLKEKYPIQASPREINMFYLGKNTRDRLILDHDTIQVLNSDKSFPKQTTREEVKKSPGSFSPNVLLRPLFQECILPNIAYIGGPSEIAYWLELKDLFSQYDVPYPVLVLRSSAVLIGKNLVDRLNKFSISDSEIFLSSDELMKRFIVDSSDEKINFDDIRSRFESEFQKLGERISRIDPTLLAVVEADNQKVKAQLQTLEEKIIRHQKKKKETEINQIRKIKETLFPSGNLQEREESILSYFLNYGSGFIDLLIENLDPFEKKFVILKEPDPALVEFTR